MKLIIFDFDGVLCPLTFEIVCEVYQHIARTMNAREDWGEGENFRRWFNPQYMHNLDRMGIVGAERVETAENLFRQYLTSKGLNMFPELDSILQALAREHRLAILTNGPEVRVKEQLRERESLFVTLVGKESMGARSKPDPYGVRLCMERAGVDPGRTALLGDLPLDILAGKNAGIARCVGVSWGMSNRQELEEAGADRVLDELRKLSAPEDWFD